MNYLCLMGLVSEYRFEKEGKKSSLDGGKGKGRAEQRQ